MQPLQTLSDIPGVQLEVMWDETLINLDHPYVDQWLKQHGRLISHLTMEIYVSNDRLKLREFSNAAAHCRSIDLDIRHSSYQVVDLADLDPVAGSLRDLIFQSWNPELGSLIGTSALISMSHLTGLQICGEDLGSEEPWGLLAKLTGLQQLVFKGRAIGDPSPLSALTGLSHLYLQADAQGPFSFSSLQPLSTLRQLQALRLGRCFSAATPLQGLAELSNLKLLVLKCYEGQGGMLRSLDGISSGVTNLFISSASGLVSLAGIEGCKSMEDLSLRYCGVSSLQPLRGLSSLKQLGVVNCNLTSLEGLNSISLQYLTLSYCPSLTHLSGTEHLSALKKLHVMGCGSVTSLQPLSQLGVGLQVLKVFWCNEVQEEVLELPNVQPTADVAVHESNVREVVLAGGVRRAAWP
jgi:Leucine-rich repeat (LRR) protein